MILQVLTVALTCLLVPRCLGGDSGLQSTNVDGNQGSISSGNTQYQETRTGDSTGNFYDTSDEDDISDSQLTGITDNTDSINLVNQQKQISIDQDDESGNQDISYLQDLNTDNFYGEDGPNYNIAEARNEIN